MNIVLMKFRTSKLACTSVAFSAIEMIVIWGDVALMNAVPKADVALISKVAPAAWLLGGLGSVVFGIVALFIDDDRAPGAAAVGFGVVVFFVCGVTMTV